MYVQCIPQINLLVISEKSDDNLTYFEGYFCRTCQVQDKRVRWTKICNFYFFFFPL